MLQFMIKPPVATPLLVRGKRITHAAELLEAGRSESGVGVTRRGRGYSDYDVISNLVRCGWLEERRTGPRGGIRWHTTDAGLMALAAVIARRP